MILEDIAAHPHTPVSVLSQLHAWSLDLAEGDGFTARGRVRATLVGNPATPVDLVRKTLSLVPGLARAVFTDSGLSAERAVALLEGFTSRQVLRPALQTVRDPDGVLATWAMDHAPNARVWQDVLHGCSPVPVRRRAAIALAARPLHTGRDRDDVCALAYADPDALGELRAVTSDEQLLADLARVATEQAHDLTPGTQAWLCHPTTTLADVLAVTRTTDQWRAALEHHVDPSGALASAAVTFAAGQPPVAAVTGLLTRVVLDPVIPDAVRCQALAAWAATGKPIPDKVRRAAPRLLVSAASDVLDVYVPRVATLPELRAIVRRQDVTAHQLLQLNAAFAHNVRRPAYVPGWADVLAQAAVTVAAHPRCTRRVREQVLQPVLSGSRTDKTIVDLRALARVALALNDASPAQVGANLPVGNLAVGQARHVPTVAALVAAALEEHLATLAEGGVGLFLTSLAEGFTGTVAELLATAASVAA